MSRVTAPNTHTPNYAVNHAQANLVRLVTASEVIADTDTRVIGRGFCSRSVNLVRNKEAAALTVIRRVMRDGGGDSETSRCICRSQDYSLTHEFGFRVTGPAPTLITKTVPSPNTLKILLPHT